MEPEVPTIREILEDYGIADFLDPNQYAEMLARLAIRENIIVTEIAPTQIYRNGMTNIINQI